MVEEMSEELRKEYDETFSDEEKTLNLLGIAKDAYTRELAVIDIDSIAASEPSRLGRKTTVSGLTETVREFGVMSPIHVMTTENYDSVSEEDVDEDGEPVIKYILIDGLRRLWAAHRNGVKTVEAVVWDFKDKSRGREIALALGLMISRVQKRSWSEVWQLYQILEMQSNITPSTLEFLLVLEPGDAMKIKDVMLSEYDEVKEELMSNTKTLEQCYKMLQKLRKEEDALAKEDATGLNVEAADGVADSSGSIELSDEDVRGLLGMSDEIDVLGEDVDFDDLNKTQDVAGVEHQKVGERHIVDQAIKNGTFARDDYHCRCCGTGGFVFLGTLIYHHLVPVHCGGPDSVENGLTLCDSCHQILHIYEQGKLPITKDIFDKYSPDEQKRIKLIMKYGNVAIEAAKLKHLSKEEIREYARSGTRHRMPGESLSEMKGSFSNYENTQSSEE